jgi:hypothetical protein
MALLTEPTQRAQTNGAPFREDLADLIAVVDAKSTPFTSMAPKGKQLGNMLFEWQVDNYDAPRVISVPDGTDLVPGDHTFSNPVENRARLKNYAEVFQREFRIGFIANSVPTVAGNRSELSLGLAKKMVEIKRDAEISMCSTDKDLREEDGNDGSLTRGLGLWIDNSEQDAPFVPSAFRTPTGSINSTATASLTDANVQDLLASIYDQTGNYRDFDAIVGTTLKRAFTNFTKPAVVVNAGDATKAAAATQVRTFSQDLGAKSWINAIDIFEGDFGRLKLHPTAFVGTTGLPTGENGVTTFTVKPTMGYVLAMDGVEIRYSSLPEVKEIPDTGGGPARLIRMIAGLCVKNPLAHGKFAATS